MSTQLRARRGKLVFRRRGRRLRALRGRMGLAPGIERLEPRCLLAASLGQTVWLDVNTDGLRDDTEPFVAAAAVELFQTSDSVAGNADDVSLGVRLTGVDGRSSFENLGPGSYYLEFRAPVGLAFTVQEPSDGARNSDADSASGRTALVVLTSESTDLALDAGLIGSPPSFGFALGTGGLAADLVRAMASDSAGNSYVTGSFVGTVDFDPGPGVHQLVSSGESDVFVAQYSSAGALVWARALGGDGADEGLDVAVSSAGDVYLTGRFRGLADFDPGSATPPLQSSGGDDVFVARLDAQGRPQWAVSLGGSGADQGRAIAATADGVVVVGAFEGLVDFQPGAGVSQHASVGATDAFLLKLDAAGNYLWSRAAGGGGSDQANDVAVQANGEAYVAGQYAATVSFATGMTLTSAGAGDAFAAKFDAGGVPVWARSFGGSENDSAASIALSDAGGVHVLGSFAGVADLDPGGSVLARTSGGAADVFVAKLDGSGALSWAQAFGGAGDELAGAMAVSQTGHVYLVGGFAGVVDFDPGSGVVALDASVVGSAFVSVLDAGGSLAYVSGLGGGQQTARAVTLGLHNDILVAGSFSGSADFDPGPTLWMLNSNGDSDAFLAKLTANRPPQITVLPGVTIAEDQVLPISGILLGDEDAGAAQLELTLTVLAGAISVKPGVVGGLASSDIFGNYSASVTLLGSMASINATLFDPAGLVYISSGDYNGADTLTLTVDDGGESGAGPDGVSQHTIDIAVTPVNDRPVAETLNVQAVEDQQLLIKLAGDDGDPELDQLLTFVITSLPATGTLRTAEGQEITEDDLPYALSGDTLYFLTATDDVSPQQFEYVIIDNGGVENGGQDTSLAATVSIQVTPVNDAPVAHDQRVTAWERHELRIDLAGEDRDPEVQQQLTFVLQSLPDAGRLSLTPGGPALTADQLPLAFMGGSLYFYSEGDYGYPTELSFYVVDDNLAGGAAKASEEAVVEIDIELVNDPPIAYDMTVVVREDAIAMFSLLGEDGDPEDEQELTFVLLSLPGGGELWQRSDDSAAIVSTDLPLSLEDGELIYVPFANHTARQTFEFMVIDDGGRDNDGVDESLPATVELVFEAVNDPPVVSGPALIEADEHQYSVVAGLLVEDPDAESSEIQVTLSVAHGTLTIQTDLIAGLRDDQVSGNGTEQLVLAGSQAQINGTLGATWGLVYRSDPYFRGSDQLLVSANDLGNIGDGSAGVAALAVGLHVTDSDPWQNTLDPLDISGDGLFTPADVVVLLNHLNRSNGSLLAEPVGAAPPPFLDPTGDNRLTFDDAVLMVDSLNEVFGAGQPLSGAQAEPPQTSALGAAASSATAIDSPASHSTGFAATAGAAAAPNTLPSEAPTAIGPSAAAQTGLSPAVTAARTSEEALTAAMLHAADGLDEFDTLALDVALASQGQDEHDLRAAALDDQSWSPLVGSPLT